MKSLTRIDTCGDFTDEGMAHMSGLTNLEELRITSQKITDKSLAALRDMTQLQSLELYSPKISGSGLVHLSRLKQLRRLKLHKTGMQPEYVHHLRRLTALQSLDVSWTPLNKDGHWKSLAVLSTLPRLNAIEIELNPDETRALEAMLPSCHVYYFE